jgi:hypothetical protein
MKSTGCPRGRKRSTAKLYILKILLENPKGLKLKKINSLLETEFEWTPGAVYPHLRHLRTDGVIKKDKEEKYLIRRSRGLRGLAGDKAFFYDLLDDFLRFFPLWRVYLKELEWAKEDKKRDKLRGVKLIKLQAEEMFFDGMNHAIMMHQFPQNKEHFRASVKQELEDMDRYLKILPHKSHERYLLEKAREILVKQI